MNPTIALGVCEAVLDHENIHMCEAVLVAAKATVREGNLILRLPEGAVGFL